MRLCFPVEEGNGINSIVYGHFGSAPCFLIYETQTDEMELIDNSNLVHEHGACNPLEALNGKMVHAVVVGGIGGGALMGLNNAGIYVLQAIEGTVKDNMEKLRNNELIQFTLQHTCKGHSGGCGH
ncbi:MAG: diguanylate cyclase [bacterium]|nr:diguanylate cyclase [bacterium]